MCSICGKLYEDAAALVETTAEAVKIPVEETEVPSTSETEMETEAEETKETKETEKPEKSEKPAYYNSGKKSQTSNNTGSAAATTPFMSPDTGDNTSVTVLIVILLLSGAGILVIGRRMRTVQ